VRALVEEIGDELLLRYKAAGRVHLDDIDAVIGTRAVSYDEVEYLITRLEGEGLRVGEPLDERDVGVMRAVLASARALRGELGRPPTVEEVATASGQALHVVRRALEDARGAARGRG
jgi:hypothetical protein